MSLILVKQCLVRMADDVTLLATLEKSPSEAELTRIRNILDYNCLGGEHLYACGGHIALYGTAQVAQCLAQPTDALLACSRQCGGRAACINKKRNVLCSCCMLNI